MISFYAFVAMMLLVGVGCVKVGSWHSQEAAYWYRVTAIVELDPSMDAAFRPILEWTKAHPPGRIERLLPWKPPDLRMSR